MTTAYKLGKTTPILVQDMLTWMNTEDNGETFVTKAASDRVDIVLSEHQSIRRETHRSDPSL